MNNKTYLAKSVKDFSEIMDTVNWYNVDKIVIPINELPLSEIQKFIDLEMFEIEYCNQEIKKAMTQKEKLFLTEKLIEAQTKVAEYGIHYMNAWLLLTNN